jgi:hypothetical protein
VDTQTDNGASSRERGAFPDDCPDGLKPRLRLFFSVDLVGATHYKQSRNRWRPELLCFYRDFDFILQTEYRAFAAHHEGRLSTPEFWKSNGDELLYVCDLLCLSHAQSLMQVWLRALRRYQKQHNPGAEHLDVKSTAWVGLFPVPNAEVFFRRGTAMLDEDLARDALVVQSELRDEWYANTANPTITRDFIGPSIDTGFRLTSLATPKRLVLSVDLAFLLASSKAPGVAPLNLRLSGKQRLKGVIDDQPYPVIWIPVERDDWACADLEPVATDRHLIRSFCKTVFEQNYASITPLFLEGERHNAFDWAPPYILKRIVRHWEEEVRHRLASAALPAAI